MLFPFTENVFNLTLDPYDYSSFTLIPLHLTQEKNIFRNKHQIFIPSNDLVPYFFIIRNLITYKKHLLLCGNAGSCKTTIMLELMEPFIQENGIEHEGFYYPLYTNCNPKSLQNFIEKSSNKKSKNTYGSKPGKIHVFFLDDVNLADYENKNNGICSELLRQILEKAGMYDRTKIYWKNIEDTCFISAYSQSSRSKLNERFFTNLQRIQLNFPNFNYNKKLFEAFLNEFFLVNSFAEGVKNLNNGLVSASLELYRRVNEHLKAVPRKFFYHFSLKEIIQVFIGLLGSKHNPLAQNNRETIIRLWSHEVFRVYLDRLSDESDKKWLKDTVGSLISQFFQYSMDFNEDTFFFSEILKTDQFFGQNVVYVEEIKDLSKVQLIIEEKMLLNSKEWNNNFIISKEIIGYLLKIYRILKAQFTRNHILNLGMIGSGINIILI